MWTINDFPAYGIVSGWSTHGKLACRYCMDNNKAFTLTNGGKASFFTITVVSCHRITCTKRTKRISLLAELKKMLHPRVFLVKNCMMLYQSTVTLCLVSNQVRRSFLVHYQKFAKYQRIYRRTISVGNLRSQLPTDTFPSVIQSVTTDGNFSVRNSVGNYRRKLFRP